MSYLTLIITVSSQRKKGRKEANDITAGYVTVHMNEDGRIIIYTHRSDLGLHNPHLIGC